MALSYEEYPELEIPNTTNLLEGFNSQLKRALHNHNEMKKTNKKKFIDISGLYDKSVLILETFCFM